MIGPCLATLIASSRRDFLKYMAKSRSILKYKQKKRIVPLFFKIDLCSATSMESSRRDLLKYMAKSRPILKYKQKTYCSLIFQNRPMFSHINGKLLPRPFEIYG